MNKFFIITPDSYGGRGGIALYNKNLIAALNLAFPNIPIIHFSRTKNYDEKIPSYVSDQNSHQKHKLRFSIQVMCKILFEKKKVHLICSHLNLLPLALLIKVLRPSIKVTLITYGYETWYSRQYIKILPIRYFLQNIIYIRRYSFERFLSWSSLNSVKSIHLPNFIDVKKYNRLPTPTKKIDEWYICTTGRMDSEPYELRKGFDEIIEIMPRLLAKFPKLRYKIIGDGSELENLKLKAKALGVAENVDFMGYISDEDRDKIVENARLFAMPGSNPEFDKYPIRFAFLEAFALKTPVLMGKIQEHDEVYLEMIKDMVSVADEQDINSLSVVAIRALQEENWNFSDVNKFSIEAASRKLKNEIFV